MINKLLLIINLDFVCSYFIYIGGWVSGLNQQFAKLSTAHAGDPRVRIPLPLLNIWLYSSVRSRTAHYHIADTGSNPVRAAINFNKEMKTNAMLLYGLINFN